MSEIRKKLMSGKNTLLNVEQYSFYGWNFTVEVGQRRFSIILQGEKDWLIIIKNETNIFRRLFGDRTAIESLAEEFEHALKIDSRFTEVQRLTEKEYVALIRAKRSLTGC